MKGLYRIMKFYFENAASLADGIKLASPVLGITPCFDASSDAAVTVSVKESTEDILDLSFENGSAVITYGSVDGILGGKCRFFRALAYLADALKRGEQTAHLTEHPLFCSNGAMVDMSRNAVMRPERVTDMLIRLALMGMNTFMLYTEDTYELENYPYFGYMRGRYTKEEIKEMDAAARSLGIELIPCIQLLGHLETMLRWNYTAPYKDTASVLLVGAEETYALIGEMLDTVSECFSSRRLHIGMDETHDLGRGASYDKNGYTPPHELYFSHLRRVTDMAKERGFRPMMWSDMFFRMSADGLPGYTDYDVRTVLPDNIGEYVPDGVQPVFWDYYQPNEHFYAVNIEKHRKLGEPVFAGGVWTWSGYPAQPERSRVNSLPALEACRKAAVKEVFVTIWHNGAESFPYTGLCGAALYAEYDYRGRSDTDAIDECLKRTCRLPYSVFTDMADVDYKQGIGSARVMVYNDPLLGLIDRHIEPIDTETYYTELSARLASLLADQPIPADILPALRVIKAVSDVLTLKADFGVRLKKVYDASDRAALEEQLIRCDRIMSSLEALRKEHRAAWMYYNKPFGYEVFDIRYGGLIARMDTAKEAIRAYLDGGTDRIEELEAKRLRYDCGKDDVPAPIGDRFTWKQYRSLVTAGIL